MSNLGTITCFCGTDLIEQPSVLGLLELEAQVLPLPHGLPEDRVRWVTSAGVLTAHAIHRYRCPLTATQTGGAPR
jgi:hypothetical protein